MKPATFYNGSLKSRFAQEQDWSRFALGVFASDNLELLASQRERGLQVFSYTHRDDHQQSEMIDSLLNDGVFLDWASAPELFIEGMVNRLHAQRKQLVVNTGWSAHKRYDYGSADILLMESFIGTNSGDDGKWPVTYSRRPLAPEIIKLRRLKDRGYRVIALTYGPSDETGFARECHDIVKESGADFFMYIQAPGWEKEGSGYRLFSDKDFKR